MNTHSTFILTPLSSLLEDASTIIKQVDWHMKTMFLVDHLLGSLFLKMTGSQEQKFKCLVWEIGAADLEYRYKTIFKSWDYGECSTLTAKNMILSQLYNSTRKFSWNKDAPLITIDRVSILFENAKKEVESFYEMALHGFALQREYNDFKRLWDSKYYLIDSIYVITNSKNGEKFTLGKNEENIKEADRKKLMFGSVYEMLYEYRNLCAHNFKIQNNNPYNLSSMSQKRYVADNYLFRFATLMLIDEIIIELYQKFYDATY